MPQFVIRQNEGLQSYFYLLAGCFSFCVPSFTFFLQLLTSDDGAYDEGKKARTFEYVCNFGKT